MPALLKPVVTDGGAPVVEVCLNLSLAAEDPNELYRYLGYPAAFAPSARIAEHIEQVLMQARSSLRPRGVYAVYPVVQQTEQLLQMGGVTISGKIGEFLRQSDRIAVFIVTVGAEISTLAAVAAKNGDAFSAWIMDALGSWAAESAADALMQRIRLHLTHGQELTLRYSPGYCGMSIAQQRKLFELLPADAVEVTLTASMLMRPMKSISGLVGLAPKEVVSQYHSPCDLCQRARCPMRR